MAMQNYTPMRLAPSLDAGLRNDLLKVDRFLRQLTPFAARIPTVPQGTPSATTTQNFNLTDFLYLPGRSGGQYARGLVKFDCDGDFVNEPNNIAQGFHLEGINTNGARSKVYFRVSDAGDVTQRWTFPDGTDNTFCAIALAQTLTNKTLGDSTHIKVGASDNGTKFFMTTGGLREFTIDLRSGFPGLGAVPSLGIPSLDNTADLHSFVFLHSNSTTPYPPGSIIYGNAGGTEMDALTNGTVGQLLQSAGGTAAPTWSSSFSVGSFVDSGFRIIGSGDATKQLAFEVDGITTATTRTITVPDFDGTVALFRSSKLRIGDTTTPTHSLELIAGTTTVAPIRLTSGTSLTTAVSGGIEMTTDNLFFTITTGTARKRLLMADPVGGLTSGRIPFVTTNGRLTDLSTLTTVAGGVTGASFTATGNVTASQVLASNVTATGNVQGFYLNATSQLDVASFMSMRNTGIRIGDTSAANYPLDILAADAAYGIYCNITNVTEPGEVTAATFSLTDSNAGVQNQNKVGLRGVVQALSNAAAGSSVPLVAGLQFENLSGVTSVITVGEITAVYATSIPFIGGGGAGSTLTLNYGIHIVTDVVGAATVAGTEVVGAYLEVGATLITVSRLAGVVVTDSPFGPGIAGATVAVAYDIDGSFGANAGTTTWYGLRIPSVSGPGTIWGIYQSGTMGSAIAGKLRIGDTSYPTHRLELAAGSTTIAPLKFTSGTSLTTAVAGVVELTTDDLFFTITTGAARKAFVLDDGSRLTSGRVPFATTNGRLVDDADFSFATDTLTITKIAATTITGNLTIADAINMVLNATTGTKIGTATTQKLAFHNSTPVVQRSGAAQAAVATTASTNIAPFGYTTAAQADAIITLLNEIRATLVEKGLMAGA